MLFEDEEWFGCRFHKEWMQPQGLGDMLGIVVLRSGSRAGWLVTQKKNDIAKFSEAELDIFRLLSPHICRAIKISDALDLRTVTSESLEATLDALSTGVFLLDGQGRVVHSNAAADRQVKTGNAALAHRSTCKSGVARSAVISDGRQRFEQFGCAFDCLA